MTRRFVRLASRLGLIVTLFAAGVVSPMLAGTASASTVDPSFGPGPDGALSNPLAPTSPFDLGRLCVGDFNGDGNQDVVEPFFISPSTHIGDVYVQFGDGTGHLGTPHLVATVTDQPLCAVADFDQDGHDDIAIASVGHSGLQVAFGQTNGSFTLSGTMATSGNKTVSAIASGDFDGDGKPDVMVGEDQGNMHPSPDSCSCDLGQYDIFYGNGDQTLTLIGPHATGVVSGTTHFNTPTRIITGDLNNDGFTDAFVGETPDAWEITGSNRNSVFEPIIQAFTATDFAFGDFNGDGKLDLAAVTGSTQLRTYLGNGAGTFSNETDYPPTNPGSTFTQITAVGASDFNGDAKPDAVVGDSDRTTPAKDGNTDLFSFTGTPQNAPALFGAPVGPFVAASSAATLIGSVVPVDLNGDGLQDLVVATTNTIQCPTCNTGPEIGVLLNTTPLPAVTTAAATAVNTTSATGNGTVNPSNLNTDYGVDLDNGCTGTFSRQAVAGSLLAGSGTSPVAIPLSGLTSDTQYCYRVYATNADGTTVGKTVSFHTTSGAVPTNTTPPSIFGTPEPDNTLGCDTGDWTGADSFAFSWLQNNTLTSDHSSTFDVQSGDVGTALVCRVTASNAVGDTPQDSDPVTVTSPTTLSIAAHRNRRHHRVLFTGTLDSNGCDVGNQTITIFDAKTSNGPATQIGTATTDMNGDYSFSSRARKTRFWFASFAGSGSCDASQSPHIRVRRV